MHSCSICKCSTVFEYIFIYIALGAQIYTNVCYAEWTCGIFFFSCTVCFTGWFVKGSRQVANTSIVQLRSSITLCHSPRQTQFILGCFPASFAKSMNKIMYCPYFKCIIINAELNDVISVSTIVTSGLHLAMHRAYRKLMHSRSSHIKMVASGSHIPTL